VERYLSSGRGYQYGNYEKTVKTQVKNRAALTKGSHLFRSRIKERAGAWINPDWDIYYDYAWALLITSRYLLKK
jgi:ribonucleoside-diphosphate reductase alpha chain